jgi:threonine/homoserine efflux transporter RhtA
MRRAISFFVACSLVVLGLVVFYLDTRSHGRLVMMGGLLVAVGGAWLWANFIGPLFGRRGMREGAGKRRQ